MPAERDARDDLLEPLEAPESPAEEGEAEEEVTPSDERPPDWPLRLR